MELAIEFDKVKRQFEEVTDKVINEGAIIIVIKDGKPAFKIVPLAKG